MSITKESELLGMQAASEAVALTLKEMRAFAQPGMSTKTVDDFGGKVLADLGAKSAPRLTYGFPGWTCISVNHEIAHGIPSKTKILHEGDLVNIDVSAELNGFYSDNGGSFVLGTDVHQHQLLVQASKNILQRTLQQIKHGVKVADVGGFIEQEARKAGYTVIRNLAGHGVGRSLHEAPEEILNCYHHRNKTRFQKNQVVAVETFISTASTQAVTQRDGWTLIGNKGGFVAQHEHTILITDNAPILLTAKNDIWA